MKSSVKITANASGEVFTKNESVSEKDGKQYGFIRLQQSVVDMSSGVAKVKTISALKSFAQDDFNKAKDFLTAGTSMPGTIVRLESLTEQKGYKVKRAGEAENAPACTVNGLPIYATTAYSPDANAQDVLIAHDNTEEIKAFQASLVGEGLNAK